MEKYYFEEVISAHSISAAVPMLFQNQTLHIPTKTNPSKVNPLIPYLRLMFDTN
jgi:hypothetical protein